MFVLFASCPHFLFHSSLLAVLRNGAWEIVHWEKVCARSVPHREWGWTTHISNRRHSLCISSTHIHRFCRRQLQDRSHTQSDTCWAPSVTSSSLQPLINPTFPCGRSLGRRRWKRKKKGELSLSSHHETISLVWEDPVLASSSARCGEVEYTAVWTQCWSVDEDFHRSFQKWSLLVIYYQNDAPPPHYHSSCRKVGGGRGINRHYHKTKSAWNKMTNIVKQDVQYVVKNFQTT